MTTSSQSLPNFILLNTFSHTQLLSLMSAFRFPSFFNKPSINLSKPLSVTDSPSYVEIWLTLVLLLCSTTLNFDT